MIIEMFPAENGDAFLVRLENGENIFIDMGYGKTYKNFIKNRLIDLKNENQCIDLLIITHIDEDHIEGAVEFFKENGHADKPNIIEVKEVWCNSYKHLQFDKEKVSETSRFEKRKLEEIKLTNSSNDRDEIDESLPVSAKQGSTLAGYLYGLGYIDNRWNRSFNYKAVNLDTNNKIELGYKKFHISNGKFDSLVYKEMLKIPEIQQVLHSYVSYLYINGEGTVIKEAKRLSDKYDGKDELYISILTIENLKYDNHPEIMDEDEYIKKLYWSNLGRLFILGEDKETFKWCLNELKKYSNGIDYIECLYRALEVFEPEEVLKYMSDLKEFKGIQCNNQMSEWYINKIMESIEKNFEGKYELYNGIMLLELSLRDIIEWENMKCTQYIIKKDPQYYAEIINVIYLHEGEEKNTKTTEECEIVQSLFDFYYKTHFCPCENNGYIDISELNAWVGKFKEKLTEQKQLNLLGHELGRLFEFSPVGEDGYYPHESVREIIEELEDDKLRSSYVVTECNKRGVYSPDAGRTEKEIALKYKDNADGVRTIYPETAKIYDSLYESYSYESDAERRVAEDVC